MSLLIDNGLILTSSTSTDRNTINSNGNDLDIITNNGNIRFQTTGQVSMTQNLVLGAFGSGGQLHNTGRIEGNSTAGNPLTINAGSDAIIIKTNNINQVQVDSLGEITFINTPRLTTPTLSSTTHQWMSMYNVMNSGTYTVTVFTSSTSATIDPALSYGRYTRFGNLCYVTLNVQMTGTLGVDGQTLQVRIGLPFTSNQPSALACSKLQNINTGLITSVLDVYGSTVLNQKYFVVPCRLINTDNNTGNMIGRQLRAVSSFAFSGIYTLI